MNIKSTFKKSNTIIRLYELINKKYIIFLSKVSPTLASKYLYKKNFGKSINLVNPKTFNEKLMWLKLYWQHPLKVRCADKYEVIEYAKEVACHDIINTVYNIYDSTKEIEWDKLPQKVVLKCTHGCGANIVSKDKNSLDKANTLKNLDKWMKKDYSLDYAEIHYKKIKPRIISEKYIEPESGLLPKDYKVFCFNGEPKVTMVCSNRESGTAKYYFFDNDWNILPYNKSGKEALKNKIVTSLEDKPKCFEKMLDSAKKLSQPFPFVRIDFYEKDDQVILGEMTFTPCGCIDHNLTKEAEYDMGEWIKLPPKMINN